LFGLVAIAVSGDLTAGGLILRLILLAAFAWVWRSYGGFREELRDTNRSGRILAWIAVFLSGAAAFLSMVLFFS
jgi:hypothetical protein